MNTSKSKIYKYSKSQTPSFISFAEKRIKYFHTYLKEIRPKIILELGCGNGSLLYEVGKLVNATLYGVDISASGVKLARKKGIIAKKADLNKEIPFKENFFDLAISDQLIEHIYNTDLFLKEIFRVLKKDGYLILITPNLSFWLNRIFFIFGMYPIFLEVSTIKKTMGQKFLKKIIADEYAMGHLRVFNLPALVDLVEESGFQVEKKIGIPLSWNIPQPLSFFYGLLDYLFSRKASLARDIMIIAKKQ